MDSNENSMVWTDQMMTVLDQSNLPRSDTATCAELHPKPDPPSLHMGRWILNGKGDRLNSQLRPYHTLRAQSGTITYSRQTGGVMQTTNTGADADAAVITDPGIFF